MRQTCSTLAIPLLAVAAISPALSAQQLASTVEPPRTVDRSFTFEIPRPAYRPGEGPIVLFDETHNNFHTAVGTYWPFVRLLEQDGYRIERLQERPDRPDLDRVDILVISDAQPPERPGDPPTFSTAEVELLEDWVRSGGALLLITDHLPDPGAIASLAAAFGIEVSNGYVLNGPPDAPAGPHVFRRDRGTLSDDPLTTGEGGYYRVDVVATFTGSAFRPPAGFRSLLQFADGNWSWMPADYYDFGPDTPRVDVSGWSQGGVMPHGEGRLAFFGEAAMFTAQVFDEGRVKAGMNAPEARDNARLLLNVVHWLSEGR